MKLNYLIFAGFGLVLVFANKGFSQDDANLHEVKPQFFEVVETVDATVEAKVMSPVTPDTKNWTTLKVKSVVDEGAVVRKGDIVVEFDTEDIELKLRESKQTVELSRLNLKGSEVELQQLDKTIKLDTELAQRKLRIAEQDFKYFEDVSRPNTEKSTNRSVENANFSLEYSQEEYNQLKRMYDEDELTEESEEIVLKRTQRDVENSHFYLEQAQMRAAKTLEFDLPREAEQKTDELARAHLEFERSKVNLPMEREKKKISFDKAVMALEKEQRDLEKLETDFGRMSIAAPADGIVYYGRCVRGAWVGPAGPARDIETGKTVPNDKTFMTIVEPKELFLRADLSEKQLAVINAKSSGWAKPTAFPDKAIAVSVEAIGSVPLAADKFDCRLSLKETVSGLLPGMTCKVRFVIRNNDKALTVPEASVFTEDSFEHFVFVAGEKVEGEETKFEKRVVKIGLTADKVTEILEGLKAGEKVSLKRQ